MRGLPVQLLRQRGLIERQLQISRKPLQPGQAPDGLGPEPLVASCTSLRPYLLENHAGSFDLTVAGQAPGERDLRTFAVLEVEPQALLDLHAPLDQAGSELPRTALGSREMADRRGNQSRIADALGLLQRHPGVGKRRVDLCLEDVRPAPVPQNPHLPHLVVLSFRKRPVQDLDDRLRVAAQGQSQLEESVGALDAVRKLGEQLVEERGRPPGSPAKR